MRKVCLITTSRADYGLQKNLIFLLKKNKKVNLKLVVAGSHLVKNYGLSIREIIEDKYKINFIFKIKYKNTYTISTIFSIIFPATSTAVQPAVLNWVPFIFHPEPSLYS